MADRDIKVDPAQTLAEVSAIAETVAQVAVPGPVPMATGATPIDAALAAVAAAQEAQASAWAAAVAATVPDQQAKSVNAVNSLAATEQENASTIGRVYPESGGAGASSV
jgi:sulfur relay (sulfurtransferase) DsrF/TusC family protein